MEDSAHWNEKAAQTVRRPVFFNFKQLKVSLRHSKHYVTLQRVLSLHFHRAGGRA
jgi:hypothetical protein